MIWIDPVQWLAHVWRVTVLTSAASMQRQAQTWRRRGVRVGLVPTMGYLHEGHLSLVRMARRLVGRGGRVVVSIYVNPMQFGPGEDYRVYPRDLAGDRVLCRKAGVDLLFAPEEGAMYPGRGEERFSTWVEEESMSRRMEGRARPGHFRGVTTVVAKLFHLVLPDVAVFGAKDYQQACVIRRMVRDLNFPIRIVVGGTVREPDGLACSSRNKYLRGSLRGQALVLFEAICWARGLVRGGGGRFRAVGLKRRMRRRIESRPGARVDYIEFFDPETLAPVREVARGVYLALAVYVGRTRLIDGGRI